MGLPFASRAVTVMVDVPLPAVIGDVAVIVDRAEDTKPGLTTTVVVCVIATALIVADTVFDPAAVEPRLPVASPLASVVPIGCVSVFPAVGPAARTTVAPAIGLPLASRAVTVMVEVPLPAVIGDVAATVDWVADTAPTFTTTVTVCVTATELIVAETVLLPAAVEASVPVATPLAFVVPRGCVKVFPAVGVAPSVTVAPSIGLPFASRAVTVMIDDPLPALIGDVAATVDCDADTTPAFTVTVAVSVTTRVPFTVAVTVFGPAAVELNVPVICPLGFVVPTGWVSVFPAVGEAASVTVAPLTGLSKPSRTVTVMVVALEPVLAVMDPGVAATSDRPALGAAALPVAVKMTGLPLSPGDVAFRVFAPVFVPSVHEVTLAIPLALVVTAAVGLTVPPPEATAKVTETFATGLLN